MNLITLIIIFIVSILIGGGFGVLIAWLFNRRKANEPNIEY